MTIEFLHVFLDELADTLEQWFECVQSLQTNLGNASEDTLKVLFRHAHNLKGSAKSVGMVGIAAFIHRVEDYVTALRDKQLPVDEGSSAILRTAGQELVLWEQELRHNPNAIRDTTQIQAALGRLLAQKEAKSSAVAGDLHSVGHGAASDPNRELEHAQAGDIVWNFGEEIPESVAGKDLGSQSQQRLANEQGHAANHQAVDERKRVAVQATKVVSQETIRVPREVIETVLSDLGELNFGLMRLGVANAPSENTVAELSALVSKAYSAIFDLVMSPIDNLFHYLTSVAEDVAKKTEKSIAGETLGKDTLVDKKTLERIKDPLMHIVRNAVDHGIEETAQREQLGKTAAGKITLRAIKKPTGILLEIRDDGKGMNPETLRQKAVEKGLIKPDALLSEKESLQLIFMAGFSTAAAVTEFSGRGVGMDVVKSTLESINGRIEIESKQGAGSKFRIFIPSKTSLLETILVRSAGSTLAITSDQIEEILLVSDSDLSQNSATGTSLHYRESYISVVDLRQILAQKIDPDHKPDSDAHCYVLVTKDKEKHAGIRVDQVTGITKQMVKQVPKCLEHMPSVIGTTRLTDGSASFVLDLSETLRQGVHNVG